MIGESPHPAPADVHALLARIDGAWRRFLAALDGIPDERMSEGGAIGDWSLKDLFGHIAFWDAQAIVEAERVLAGLPERELEWQAMNDTDYAARRCSTLPQQRAEMHQAHAALLDRLDDVAGIEAAQLDAAIKGASYEHYEEHIPDILRWRERHGL